MERPAATPRRRPGRGAGALLLLAGLALAGSLPVLLAPDAATAPLPANPAAQRAEMIRLLRSIDERLARLVEAAERGHADSAKREGGG